MNRLQDARRAIGLAVQHLRTQSKFATTGKLATKLRVPESMIRGIEAGHVQVPPARALEFANAISSDAVTVSSGALIEAYAAAIYYASRHYIRNDARYQWLATLENQGPAKAYALVEAELRRQGSRDISARHPVMQSIRDFNPVQVTLLQRLATVVRAFGTDIVSDGAIAEWENFNADVLQSIAAVVPCVESELRLEYQQALAKTISGKDAQAIRYLILTTESESQAIVVTACEELRRLVAARLREQTSKARDICEEQVNRNLLFRTVPSTSAFEQIRKAFYGPDDSMTTKRRRMPGGTDQIMWDGFYLYGVRDGYDLLIGVFRRLPASASSVPASTIRRWNSVIYNESLPWARLDVFRSVFEDIWKTAQPLQTAKDTQ